jgi:hypothetical protein
MKKTILVALLLIATLYTLTNTSPKQTEKVKAVEIPSPTVTTQPAASIAPTEPIIEVPVPIDPLANPNNCDMNTQWIWEDASCHDKVSSPPTLGEGTSFETAMSGGCELAYNYTSWDQRTAYAVCMAESNGNTNATNWNDNHGSCVGSFGLFQIACIHDGSSYDPIINVAAANRLYNQSGWSIWGAYTSGAYLKYL